VAVEIFVGRLDEHTSGQKADLQERILSLDATVRKPLLRQLEKAIRIKHARFNGHHCIIIAVHCIAVQ
jgi:hypothetical protein